MSAHGYWLVSDAYHRTQDQEQHVDRAQLSKNGAALARALNSDTMMPMARTSGLCQRMRSVTPQELVVAVIAAMATQSTETIADVLEILEDRHGAGSTVVTSQLPVGTWHDYIAHATVADAVLDRLVHNAHKLTMKGPLTPKGEGSQPLSRQNLVASLRLDDHHAWSG